MASRLESCLESYFLDVIAEPGRSGPAAVVTRGVLGGLSGLYDIGLEAYLMAERFRLRRRESLPISILSIGNLTVGGTGKTPMTQLLCRRFQSAGKRVAILSRGHGGSSQAVRLVSDADGQVFLGAGDAGDEPILLARTLPGIPIVVGKDRRQSGREVLRCFDLDVLILDDGFQYWQLARDLDIVLLDCRRPFDNGYPLPRGLLREPKRHLSRAKVVVATRAGRVTTAERARLSAEISHLAPRAKFFFADHRAIGFVPANDLAAPLLLLSEFTGQRVFAVSAIAQPLSFVETLTREAGVIIVGQKAWDDHHAVTEAEVRTVSTEAMRLGAVALVMTEKDAVKWPAGDFGLPTYALRIEMAVEDEAGFLRAVCEAARLTRH